MQTEAAQAVTKIANTAQYGGGSAAVYFGLTANEWAAFGGLAIGVIGLVMNWWFKRQHLTIAKQAARANTDE